ncbi:PLP-dependent aminotransferase family protein [Ideonella azotifigens]|uniref:PLP-dependent aminotransferase family protein n=1 Tax=Ideonella azotifigens TaxID=513160 RepID=A0ABN1KCV7_9BURK|nr:PLP-dependent aminotransferase family protein [Ideonella azotifigens]MCD2343676.1 PLP-dependent aminotransferase family protein [Ideonella azotifigens]
MLQLQPQSSISLVAQIVEGLRSQIEQGGLRAGAKVPSIRQFAHAHQVSVFTVVEAYDRLVAQGWLVSRPHSGFFVRRRAQADGPAQTQVAAGQGFDAMWYMRKIFEHRHLSIKAGCGWLPGDWLAEDGLRRALRGLASEDADLGGYGDPKGYPPLRQFIAEAFAEQEVQVHPSQVLLTQGSSQALDLAVRRLVRAGDTVLVDDPGYANLLFSLRFQGATLVGVPRTPQGYDLPALERLIVAHQPKVFFTQPRLQSPTGSVAQLAHLHRVLQLAEKHDLTIVENDIYVDLDPNPRPSLASLDQLSRVITVGSYSKTISPNIRVGYLVAHPDMVEDLAQLKMIAGLTSAEFGERLALGVLIEGRWRKHLKGLRERLADAHQQVGQRLSGLGFELFAEPKAGMFLWARHPLVSDPVALSNKAAEHDIMLGPGHLFSADLGPTPWMRFNVAFSLDTKLAEFFQAQGLG